MCDISLEPCDVWTETERTARKEHVCSSCRGRILPKARYWTHFSKYDGEVSFQRICGPCYAARDEFANAHESTPVPAYFPTLLRECIDDHDEESKRRWGPMLAALVARAAPAKEDEGG